MATATAKATKETSFLSITIPEIEKKKMSLTLIGDSSLIEHRWSEKAKKEILDKQMKKSVKAKEAKSPVGDFMDSLYWLTDEPDHTQVESEEEKMKLFNEAVKNGAKFGFPCVALKQSAIDAAYQQGLVDKKTTLRGAFFIAGEDDNPEMMTIHGIPTMREDMVVIGGMSRTADIRYRGEFQTWSTTVNITYNPRVISAEQIAAFIDNAGFASGLGEWRVSKNGQFGSFHVKRS